MNDLYRPNIGRRNVLHALSMSVAAATVAPLCADAAPRPATAAEKDRGARYQANSPEVQTFYRVNRYPKK